MFDFTRRQFLGSGLFGLLPFTGGDKMSVASLKNKNSQVIDPIEFCKKCWPHITLYDKQIEIMYSVMNNDETFVPAGNMLGKDFISGLIVIWFFMTRYPCRIVTTSAKDDHLRVLWGEIGNFIQTSVLPLDVIRGGCLIVNQREIRRIVNGEEDRVSYVIGMVASDDKVAAMQGHHASAKDVENSKKENKGRRVDAFAAHDHPLYNLQGLSSPSQKTTPLTLFVGDEASSLPNEYYTMCSTWAKRMLIIGNTWPCENFFKHAIKGKPGTDDVGGDIKAPNNGHYYRKIIQIKAEDSPNVKLGLLQEKNGKTPTNEMLIDGVKDYETYMKNRKMWDKVQQCVSLDAEFYEGVENYLFPKEWLDRAEKIAERILGGSSKAITIGVDPAEGGDNTCWAVIGRDTVLNLIVKKTPDTSVITGETIALMKQYNVIPENVVFDRGGGGKEHADRLRTQGYNVRTVAFGESLAIPPRHGITYISERKEHIEERYTYKNRRAQMYGLLSNMMDPSYGSGFGIPKAYKELRRQLAAMPRSWDSEGRLFLPPKNKKSANSTEPTIRDILGCSPDEADALVLAVFGMLEKPRVARVGAF